MLHNKSQLGNVSQWFIWYLLEYRGGERRKEGERERERERESGGVGGGVAPPIFKKGWHTPLLLNNSFFIYTNFGS